MKNQGYKPVPTTLKEFAVAIVLCMTVALSFMYFSSHKELAHSEVNTATNQTVE